MTTQFLPELAAYIAVLIGEHDQIPPARRELLLKLSRYIQQQPSGAAQLNFICTHNSRRSHLAQIWAAVAAAYYGLDRIATFSGGTETTAFNPRAVDALERAGFRVERPDGANPRYRIYYSDALAPLECFSKTYNHPDNPQTRFAAIMTCSDADENCPFIPGAELRLPLTYQDPKEADDSPQEAERYDERTRQIGRELFFALRHARATPPAN